MGKPSIKDVIGKIRKGLGRVEIYVLYPMIPKLVVEYLIDRYKKIKVKADKRKKT